MKCMEKRSCYQCEHGGRDKARTVEDHNAETGRIITIEGPAVCTKFIDGFGFPALADTVRSATEECEHFEPEKPRTIESMFEGIPEPLRSMAKQVHEDQQRAAAEAAAERDKGNDADSN